MKNPIFSNTDNDFIKTTDKMLRDQVDATFRHELEHFKSLGLGDSPCRVLDIGCGNAYYLSQLAMHFPESSFVGIDVNEKLISRGCEYIKQYKLNNVTLKICSFSEYHAEEPYDFVLSMSVLLHISNELDDYFKVANRLLKKNGKLVIIDCDDQYWLIYPEYEIFSKLLNAISAGFKKKNVDRYIARKLPGYMRNNGFVVTEFKPTYLCNVHVGNELVFDLLRSYAKIFSDRSAFSEEDCVRLEEAIRMVGVTNDFLYVSPGILICGIKEE